MVESAEDLAANAAGARTPGRVRRTSHARPCGGRRRSPRSPCGGREVLARDECPRPGLTAVRMARIPCLVRREVTVTACNSSQHADGAAAVVFMAGAEARRRGLSGLCHVDGTTVGVAPRHPNLGAVAAVADLRGRDPRFDPRSVTRVAMTEAFAAQMLVTIDDLGSTPNVSTPTAVRSLWVTLGRVRCVQVVRLFADLTTSDEDATGLALAAVAGGWEAPVVRGGRP